MASSPSTECGGGSVALCSFASTGSVDVTLVLILQCAIFVVVLFNYIATRAANVRQHASGPPALPSVFQVRQMVLERTLSPDDAGLVLAAQGYPPELVVPLLKSWQAGTSGTEAPGV